MKCKHCGNNTWMKDGFIGGKQRYKCKKCRKTFRCGDERKKYSTERKVQILTQSLFERKNIGVNKFASAFNVNKQLLKYWKEHYKDMLQNEINAFDFPEFSKVELLNIQDVETWRNNMAIKHGFCFIWTEKGAKFFMLKGEKH